MFTSPLIAALAAVVAAAPADTLIETIRALDDAASFELDRATGCSGEPDRDAAAAAERAAHIHQTRLGLGRELATAVEPADQVSGPEELVPLALQASGAFERQFACDPTDPRPLEVARDLLVKLRAELNEASSGAASLSRRIAALEGQLAGRPAPAPEVPAEPRGVRLVVLDGEVTPGPKDPYLGRLALRVELGASFVRAGEPPTGFHHRGPAGRVSLLARHHVSERRRVHLLFGPYYGLTRVAAPGQPQSEQWYAGPMIEHRIGGHFEVQWVPSARLERWLSLNPAVEVGLEVLQHDRMWGYTSGIQVGGGLSLCIWHQSICPGARAFVTPLANRSRPTGIVAIQAGLALDLLRFAAIAHDRKARKRAP